MELSVILWLIVVNLVAKEQFSCGIHVIKFKKKKIISVFWIYSVGLWAAELLKYLTILEVATLDNHIFTQTFLMDILTKQWTSTASTIEEIHFKTLEK